MWFPLQLDTSLKVTCDDTLDPKGCRWKENVAKLSWKTCLDVPQVFEKNIKIYIMRFDSDAENRSASVQYIYCILQEYFITNTH